MNFLIFSSRLSSLSSFNLTSTNRFLQGRQQRLFTTTNNNDDDEEQSTFTYDDNNELLVDNDDDECLENFEEPLEFYQDAPVFDADVEQRQHDHDNAVEEKIDQALEEAQPGLQRDALVDLEPDELKEGYDPNLRRTFAHLFQESKSTQQDDENDEKLSLEDLKYFKLYPKKVRRWVEHLKTPPGYFNDQGFFVPAKDPQVVEKHLEMHRERMKVMSGRLDAASSRRGLRNRRNPDDVPVPPADVQDAYRFDVKEEELKQAHPKVRSLLNFVEATQSEINEYRINRAMKRWARKDGDTGSAQVQVARLTEKVKILEEHMEMHRKDMNSKRVLRKYVNQRRKLMNYLKKKNTTKYFEIAREYNLRDDIAG